MHICTKIPYWPLWWIWFWSSIVAPHQVPCSNPTCRWVWTSSRSFRRTPFWGWTSIRFLGCVRCQTISCRRRRPHWRTETHAMPPRASRWSCWSARREHPVLPVGSRAWVRLWAGYLYTPYKYNEKIFASHLVDRIILDFEVGGELHSWEEVYFVVDGFASILGNPIGECALPTRLFDELGEVG